MQLKVKLNIKNEIELPLSYNHIIQSALLNLGKNDNSVTLLPLFS